MAKSIRSKIHRKNRSHFRSTIGEEAAQKNMDKIQSKLKEVIGEGQVSSVAKLSSILDVGSDRPAEEVELPSAMDESTGDNLTEGKSCDKIPVKAKRGKGAKEWSEGCYTKRKKLYFTRKPRVGKGAFKPRK